MERPQSGLRAYFVAVGSADAKLVGWHVLRSPDCQSCSTAPVTAHPYPPFNPDSTLPPPHALVTTTPAYNTR